MDMINGEEKIRCLLYGRNDGRRAGTDGKRRFAVMFIELELDQLGEGKSSTKETVMDRLHAELTEIIAEQADIAYFGSHGYRSIVCVLSFFSLDEKACSKVATAVVKRLNEEMPEQRIGLSASSRSLHMLKHLLHQAEYNAASPGEARREETSQPAASREGLKHHHHAKVVEGIKRHIREHLEQIETVEQLAAQFYFSPSYMNHIFKRHAGITIFDYIISSRMEAAKRMLKEPKAKAIEVSLKLGYQNYSHFNALFKQRTGLTPKQYSRKYG